jgi:hypothetical protein
MTARATTRLISSMTAGPPRPAGIGHRVPGFAASITVGAPPQHADRAVQTSEVDAGDPPSQGQAADRQVCAGPRLSWRRSGCDEHRTTPPCWSRRAGPNPSPGTPAYEQSRHRIRLGAADRAVATGRVASLRWGGRLTLADRGKVRGVVAVVAVLVAATLARRCSGGRCPEGGAAAHHRGAIGRAPAARRPEGNGSDRERIRRRAGRAVGAMIRSARRRYGPPDQHPAMTAPAR